MSAELRSKKPNQDPFDAIIQDNYGDLPESKWIMPDKEICEVLEYVVDLQKAINRKPNLTHEEIKTIESIANFKWKEEKIGDTVEYSGIVYPTEFAKDNGVLDPYQKHEIVKGISSGNGQFLVANSFAAVFQGFNVINISEHASKRHTLAMCFGLNEPYPDGELWFYAPAIYTEYMFRDEPKYGKEILKYMEQS